MVDAEVPGWQKVLLPGGPVLRAGFHLYQAVEPGPALHELPDDGRGVGLRGGDRELGDLQLA